MQYVKQQEWNFLSIYTYLAMLEFVKQRIGYVALVTVLALLILLGGRQAVMTTISPNPSSLALYIAATGMLFFISSVRWGMITNAVVGFRVCSYVQYFFYQVSGRLIGQYASQAGSDLIYRPFILKQGHDETSLHQSMQGTLWDKAMDLVFAVTLFVSSVPYLAGALQLIPSLALWGSAIALSWLLISRAGTMRWLVDSLMNVGYQIESRVPFLRGRIVDLNQHRINTLPPIPRSTIRALLTLTVLKYLLTLTRLYFLALALDLSFSADVLWAGIPVGQLSLILAVTPGGLGFVEGGWYGVLALQGATRTEISAFLIGERVYLTVAAGLALILAIGVLALQRTADRKSTLND